MVRAAIRLKLFPLVTAITLPAGDCDVGLTGPVPYRHALFLAKKTANKQRSGKGKVKWKQRKKKQSMIPDEQVIDLVSRNPPTQQIDPSDRRAMDSCDNVRKRVVNAYKDEYGVRVCFSVIRDKPCRNGNCQYVHFNGDVDHALETKDHDLDRDDCETPTSEGDEVWFDELDSEASAKVVEQTRDTLLQDMITNYPYMYYNVYRFQVSRSLSGSVAVPLTNDARGANDDFVTAGHMRIDGRFLFDVGGETLGYTPAGRIAEPADPDLLPTVPHHVSTCGRIILCAQAIAQGPQGIETWCLRAEVERWTVPSSVTTLNSPHRPLNPREKLAAVALLSATSDLIYRGGDSVGATSISRRALATLRREHGRQDDDDYVVAYLLSSGSYCESVSAMTAHYKSSTLERLDARIRIGMMRVERSYRSLRYSAIARVVLKTIGFGLLSLTGVGTYWGLCKLAEYADYGFEVNVRRHMLDQLSAERPSPVKFLAKKTLPRVVCKDSEKLREAEEQLDLSIVKLDTVDDDAVDDSRAEVYGSWIDKTPSIVPSGCPKNVKSAVTIRMGKLPEVDDKEVNAFVSFAKEVLRDIKLEFDEQDTMTYLRSHYGERRAKAMYDEWYQVPFDKKFVGCRIFAKAEWYPKTRDNFKPRMIWPRHPWFVVNLGAYFHGLAKALKKVMRERYNTLYTSGETPDTVGQWVQAMERFGFKFDADVSNWDGSLSSFFLTIERYFLTNCVDAPSSLLDVLPFWDQVVGYTFRDHESYMVSMDRGRRSGDLWTSCFNSLLNMLLNMYVMQKLRPNATMAMVVMGDDCITAFDRPAEKEDIVNTYVRLGMKVTVNIHATLLDAEFCSGYFAPVHGIWRWCNKPFRQLAKMGINHHNKPSKQFKGLLYGTAKSLLCTSGHVPIIGSFLRAITDSCAEKGVVALRDKRDNWDGRIQGGVCVYPSSDTYEWFCLKYGIPLEVVVAMEEWIENNVHIDLFPCQFTAAEFQEGFVTDVGEPCENDEPHFTVDDLMRWSREEELLKLRTAKRKGITPFRAGYEYGLTEREMGLMWGAPQVHAVMSLVSSINLEAGVQLHQCLNMVLWRAQSETFLAKKSAGKRKTKAKQPRKKTTSGRPAWKTALGNVMRAGGTAIGTYMGNPALGQMGGDFLSKITGMGDYTIHSNSLMQEKVTFGNGDVRVAHREFIGLVYSSQNFSTTVYDINPGLYASFPWLSVMARNYERYDIRGLGFEFVTTAGYLTTTQAQGVVIMATQYDPDAAEFVNRREMESYMYTTSSEVTAPLLHLVECNPKDRPLELMYLRYGTVDEERFTDLGRFTIAVEGCPADDVVLGELWVTYDVLLQAPRLEAHGYANASWARLSNGGYTNTEILGAIQIDPIGPLGITVSDTNGGYDTINFPPTLDHGYYLTFMHWRGDSTASLTATWGYTNCEATIVFLQDTSGFASNSGTTASSFVCCRVIHITGRQASIDFSTATLPANGSSLDALVVQMGNPEDAMTLLADCDYTQSLKLRGVTVVHPKPRLLRNVRRFDEETALHHHPPEPPLLETKEPEYSSDGTYTDDWVTTDQYARTSSGRGRIRACARR